MLETTAWARTSSLCL